MPIQLKFLVSVWTSICISFFVTGIHGQCLKPLNEIGCKTNNDCGDFNGHQLECRIGKNVTIGANNEIIKQCQCPNGTDCYRVSNNTVPQFGKCSETMLCVKGHGQKTKNTSSCQQSLVCSPLVLKLTEEAASVCHTCDSCQDMNRLHVTFDCDDACGIVKAAAANLTDSIDLDSSLDMGSLADILPRTLIPTANGSAKQSVVSLGFLGLAIIIMFYIEY